MGVQVRFRPLVLILALAAALLLPGLRTARADHSVNQDCYVCHNIKSGQVWQNSHEIWSGRNIGMSPYSKPITCDVCHTDYGAALTSANESHHPVATISGTTMASDNYLSLPMSITCRDCHNADSVTLSPNLNPDLAPSSYLTGGNTTTDGYPDHDVQTPDDVVNAGDPPHLQAMILNAGQRTTYATSGTKYVKIPTDNSLSSIDNNFGFCLSCHDGSGNSARNVDIRAKYTQGGHYYQGDNTTVNQGAAAFRVMPCSDCHDSHSSTTNARLLQPDTSVFVGTFTGRSYDNPVSPSADNVRRVCMGCHDDTNALPGTNGTPTIRGREPSKPDNTVADHATYTGTKTTASCTVCHDPHAPTVSCYQCHGDIGGTVRGDGSTYPPNVLATYGWTESTSTPASLGDHRKHAGSTAADNAGTAAYVKACAKCHNMTSHIDNLTNATMDNATVSYIWNAGASVGKTSVTDDYCMNVACHSPYSAAENPSNVYKSGTAFTSGTLAYRRYWIDNASWNCYTCHAYDGRTGNTGLNPRPATGNKYDNTMWTGSHAAHVDNSMLSCRECHPAALAYAVSHKSGFVNVGFENSVVAGGTYDNTAVMLPTDNIQGTRRWATCSTVYCHSNVQTESNKLAAGRIYPTGVARPVWGTAASGNCGNCHGGDGVTDNASSLISSGTHSLHVNRTNYRIACVICHPYAGTNNDNHANARIEVVMSGTWNYGTGSRSISVDGLFDNAQAIAQPNGVVTIDNSYAVVGADNAYGQCSALACHNNGRGLAPLTSPPRWGQVDSNCVYCHRGDSTSGSPWVDSSYAGDNSHTAHLAFACGTCHYGTVGTSNNRVVTGYDNHVNGRATVVFAPGINVTFDNNTKQCSGTSCHGTPTPLPDWDNLATVTSCFSCHDGIESGARPFESSDNVANKVALSQWTGYGHGRTTLYSGSGDNAAGFDVTNGTGCYYCHSSSASHIPKSASDPYRLGTDNQALNNLCNKCHTSAGTGSPKATNPDNFLDNGIHGGMNLSSNKTWPGNYDYKCVDCHDPHGDNNWQMVRYNINAPTASSDANSGSGNFGTPKRTTPFDNVVFTSFAGFAAGSYAISGTAAGQRGICEVCHTQTTKYARVTVAPGIADNAGTHAGYTGDCMVCHNHDQGFKGGGCANCHGPNGNISNAPNIGTNFNTSGHGRFTIECEQCHDLTVLTTTDHKGNLAGTPPANINTLTWPGKVTGADNAVNLNTVHLKLDYISTSTDSYGSPATRAALANTFDQVCFGPRTGCHDAGTPNHNHQKIYGALPENVLRFGDNNSNPTPKGTIWYPLATYQSGYAANFYATPSVWADNDISLLTGKSDQTTTYGLCVSCHDPHGTAVTDTSATFNSNHMLRGNWYVPNSYQFCAKACHNQ